MNNLSNTRWPALPYSEFKSTAHLLHMGVQMIGKLKLYTPFEPHWANVYLQPTARGITSGIIPYKTGVFSIDIDFIEHQIIISTSWGKVSKLALESMSVAQLYQKIFLQLRALQIDLTIKPQPQEIASPIAFDQDIQEREYNHELANAWWRILLSSYQVIQRYHARFDGETPPVGLMWGTFDLRDARYNGVRVSTAGANAGYIRRNAMDEAQIEVGWWHGNDNYQRAAYYSFTYPQADKIELANIQPQTALWNKELGEFILDYDVLRSAVDPENDLLNFFESTYQAGVTYGKWNPSLQTTGRPL